MKQLSHLASCFWLLLVFSPFVIAQEKIKIEPDFPPPNKALPVLKEIGQARVTFNERTNKAVARTNYFYLRFDGESSDKIGIAARFASQGKKVIKPETIILEISPVTKDRTFVDDRRIKIFIEESQVLNSISKFIEAYGDEQMIQASLEQELPFELFVKMSEAEQIKVQIGPTQFELKENELKRFRDLLKIIREE